MERVRNFEIMGRHASSPTLTRFEPNFDEWIYVASAINIALGFMEQPRTKECMVDLALAFENSDRGLNHFRGDPRLAMDAVNLFVAKLRASFPAVVLDDQLTDLDCLGYHPRGEWNGNLHDFDARIQMVFLNAERVRDMIRATRSGRNLQFRTFQFLFAVCFVHEVAGHMLITFICNGRPVTPPEISAYGYTVANRGESGRYLETHLFGGTTEFYNDPRQDRHQTGIPYQIGQSGWAYRLHNSVIEDALNYNFQLPFRRDGPAVEPNSLRSLGRAYPALPITPHDPRTSDPRNRSMAAMQSPLGAGRLPGYNVRIRDLMEIPMHPSRRLVAVA